MQYTTQQYTDKQGPGFVQFGLTGFGQRFVETGKLRGYGYRKGGITGYTTPLVKLTTKWESFRQALATGSIESILQAAKSLPSLTVSLPGRVDQLRISYKGSTLFTARVC